jgi:hypothetical protein
MSEQARVAAERICGEVIRGGWADTFTGIIDAAITATAALRAENERLRARLRNSTMPLPNAQDLIDAQAERLLLARLAKCQEEPQFYNPLEAAAAITLRDRVLAEAGARTATSAHGQ